jgi:allophanate hydrolase subunit 2
MAERQTTGGYPKIATVASVDLPRLAQAMTGSSLRFKLVSQDEAEELLIAQSQALTEALSGLEEKSDLSGREEESGDE